MDERIVVTVIALDVAFRALLGNARNQLPGLAMLLREELEHASRSRVADLPEGVKQQLAEYAALLTRRPSA